jgi:hypothetical protein
MPPNSTAPTLRWHASKTGAECGAFRSWSVIPSTPRALVTARYALGAHDAPGQATPRNKWRNQRECRGISVTASVLIMKAVKTQVSRLDHPPPPLALRRCVGAAVVGAVVPANMIVNLSRHNDAPCPPLTGHGASIAAPDSQRNQHRLRPPAHTSVGQDGAGRCLRTMR